LKKQAENIETNTDYLMAAEDVQPTLKAIIIDDYDFRRRANKDGFIPLYTLRAACGYFEDGEVPEVEGWINASGHGFRPDPERHFAVHAKGDSMLVVP
jgi:SOS-response transcriptional repressor LexA